VCVRPKKRRERKKRTKEGCKITQHSVRVPRSRDTPGAVLLGQIEGLPGLESLRLERDSVESLTSA